MRNSYLHTPNENSATNITLLPGNGIGPEITHSVRQVFEAANVPLDFDVIENFDFNDK